MKETCQICTVCIFKPFQSHETLNFVCIYNNTLFPLPKHLSSSIITSKPLITNNILSFVWGLYALNLNLFAFVRLVAILLYISVHND